MQNVIVNKKVYNKLLFSRIVFMKSQKGQKYKQLCENETHHFLSVSSDGGRVGRRSAFSSCSCSGASSSSSPSSSEALLQLVVHCFFFVFNLRRPRNRLDQTLVSVSCDARTRAGLFRVQGSGDMIWGDS